MNKTAFIAKMTPYATRASQAVGIPTEVILTQWAHESGFGSSRIAQPPINNFGGIKYVGAKTQDRKDSSSSYAAYHSINQFTDDYIRVMSLSYYKKIRDAGSAQDTIRAFTGSPYAEDNSYSQKLASVFNGIYNAGVTVPIPSNSGKRKH